MLRRAVNILLLFPFLFVVACPAQAQEIFVSGRFVTDTRHGTSSGQWSVAYVQGLAEYAAFSISYINEGHQPNHYRDGLAPQIWGRAAPFGPNLSLAIGMDQKFPRLNHLFLTCLFNKFLRKDSEFSMRHHPADDLRCAANEPSIEKRNMSDRIAAGKRFYAPDQRGFCHNNDDTLPCEERYIIIVGSVTDMKY